jgi:hypothetical protein
LLSVRLFSAHRFAAAIGKKYRKGVLGASGVLFTLILCTKSFHYFLKQYYTIPAKARIGVFCSIEFYLGLK